MTLHYIIQILLISLGFEASNYNAPRSLHPATQQQYKPMKFHNPMTVALAFIIGIILFALFVFMFMPGTESGLVYNGLDGII